jgi:imidazolonepropionase-like amidohydrolase
MRLGSIRSASHWVVIRTGAFKPMFIMKSLLAVSLTATLVFAVSAAAQEEKPKPQVLFTNVNIFDGKSNKLAEGMSVLVEGNLIKNIAKGNIEADGATIIDGGGRTLMPGLIDGHTHLNMTTGVVGIEKMPWDEIGVRSTVMARDWLNDGFTTVRDMGGMGGRGLKRAVDAGHLIGPRIYPSGGWIGQTSGHQDFRVDSMRSMATGNIDSHTQRLGITRTADGPERVLEAARDNLFNGATQLKIMTGGGVASQNDPLHVMTMTTEEIEAAVKAAKDFDTYVGTHVFSPEGIRRSLEAGVMTIEHGFFIDEDTMMLLKAKDAYIVAQMTGIAPEQANNPVLTPVSLAKLNLAFKLSGNFVELVKKHKPNFVFQTDALGDFGAVAKQRAYEKYRHAELFGNFEMLKAATSTAGKMLQLTGKLNPYPEGPLGVIQEGAYADILIVDGNPIEDVTVIGAVDGWFSAPPRKAEVETIRVIMKDGKIYKNTL